MVHTHVPVRAMTCSIRKGSKITFSLKESLGYRNRCNDPSMTKTDESENSAL